MDANVTMKNIDVAKELGFTEKEVNSLVKTLAYRKEYNARPEVKERRKAYAAARNARLSMLAKLLKEN